MKKTGALKISLLILVLLALAGTALWWFLLRPPTLPPSATEPFAATGGEFFSRRIINDVPQFLQDDPRWYHDEIGTSGSRLGPEGCAVAASAMVLASRGIQTNPGELNAFLTLNEGYTERGWIYWEKACELAPEKIWKSFEGIGSHELIDHSLKRGLSPIIKIYLPNGISHFVVIVGKEGSRYLIRDPSSRLEGKVAWLDEAHPTTLIYGVRLYDYK